MGQCANTCSSADSSTYESISQLSLSAIEKLKRPPESHDLVVFTTREISAEAELKAGIEEIKEETDQAMWNRWSALFQQESTRARGQEGNKRHHTAHTKTTRHHDNTKLSSSPTHQRTPKHQQQNKPTSPPNMTKNTLDHRHSLTCFARSAIPLPADRPRSWGTSEGTSLGT